MLISGHIYEYLDHWRNLYVHSQQGWEALNNFVKKYLLRRTNRGGNRGSGSRIEGVVRWLICRLMWMTELSYEEIKETVAKNVDGHMDLKWDNIEKEIRESTYEWDEVDFDDENI